MGDYWHVSTVIPNGKVSTKISWTGRDNIVNYTLYYIDTGYESANFVPNSSRKYSDDSDGWVYALPIDELIS